MATTRAQPFGEIWKLVERQHGVVSRGQLAAAGTSPSAIAHLVRRGLLHRVARGVYAVGRPQLTREGRWAAALLACGRGAALSHRTAGQLWGVCAGDRVPVHVTVGPDARRRHPGLVTHRRALRASDVAARRGLAVTDPALTLVDLAATLPRRAVERAVNEADKLDLVDPEALRSTLAAHRGRPGVARLRTLLDGATFRLTDSELERRFLNVIATHGFPTPETGRRIDGFKTDFYWPALGLVVETDGLRYHRTPTQQARDRLRDQRHAARGLTTLRFTHAQIRYEPGHVAATLRSVMRRLSESSGR